jgi:hypothetical protein
MARISTDVDIEVDADAFSTEELTEELESRGYTVTPDNQPTHEEEQLEYLKDKLHGMYRDFLLWKDFGTKDSTFENSLKMFFEDTLDEKLV